MTTERKIITPDDLTTVLDELKAQVERGNLVQYWEADAICATQEALHNILSEGPWPDYIEIYLQDVSTGGRYRLIAETYHGSGGSLAQLPP